MKKFFVAYDGYNWDGAGYYSYKTEQWENYPNDLEEDMIVMLETDDEIEANKEAERLTSLMSPIY
jgi:hypothetical protein